MFGRNKNNGRVGRNEDNARVADVDRMAEAKGYSQRQADFLKSCAEWANDKQWEWICKGLEHGFDVSKYADPKFDFGQMAQIYVGLAHGLDVSKYADPKFDVFQMTEICKGLGAGVDVSKYADPKCNWYQMLLIREQLEGKKD